MAATSLARSLPGPAPPPPTTAPAGAGADINQVVGPADGVFVVLDNDEVLPLSPRVSQGLEQDLDCLAGAGRWWARRARSRRLAGCCPAARRGGCAAPRRPKAWVQRGRDVR